MIKEIQKILFQSKVAYLAKCELSSETGTAASTQELYDEFDPILGDMFRRMWQAFDEQVVYARKKLEQK